MSDQVRLTSLGSTSTSTLVAARPARVTAPTDRRIGSTPTASTADCSTGRGGTGVDERAEHHVAARAGTGVEPGERHAGASCRAAVLAPARRATLAAKTPAPNPLSMLQTVTPGAHELSIASRAASPPYDVP